MSPEAQRIAIAEACGWRKGVEAKVGRTGIAWFRGPDDDLPDVIYHLPDYLSDLNAMHAAQAILTDEQWREYLSLILFRHPKNFEWSGLRCVADSDAARLADAFLRTLNLWDDSK